jgi:hypothetical protein
MAEAVLRAFGGESFEAFSARTEANGIRPETIQVRARLAWTSAGSVRDPIRNRLRLVILAGGRSELPAPQPTVLP